MSALACKELSKWYGNVIAVNDVTVSLKPGVTGVLGPNGAGKSSLFRMAMGLARPSRGSIEVLGEDPWDNPGLLRRIGYLPEQDAPWPDLPAQRGALLAARYSGLEGSAAEAAVDRAFRQVGLHESRDRLTRSLSRGMRQRLKFALALLHEPELLILDEPLLGTDPLSRRDLLGLMRDLAARGTSIVVSTHVLPDVEAMTQRIMLLNRGRLMAHGEVGEIRDLLERFPRTVRVATPRSRELGAQLSQWETVNSVQPEEGALLVSTKRPQEFYAELQRYLARSDVPFTSVTSPDDNVEAVFKYLVG